MNAVIVDVAELPTLEHEEAMRIAAEEYDRLLDLVARLEPRDWGRPTDCPGWDVKAMLGHLLGMMEIFADRSEATRQHGIAARLVEQQGGLRIDALTALQVREHTHLGPAELAAAMSEMAPRALAGRRATTAEDRSAPYPTGIPGEASWTRGYLVDVIMTRDPWMHRVDVCRATGRQLTLTAEHDGRILADVVADWARRHGRPFTLVLGGPSGGTFTAGSADHEIRLDAVEFCRILSGRGSGTGLLATSVPF
jgi:uncharacterized protein (TIGR03083 family)